MVKFTRTSRAGCARDTQGSLDQKLSMRCQGMGEGGLLRGRASYGQRTLNCVVSRYAQTKHDVA